MLLPLACERADHDVVRGLTGDGDGDGDMVPMGGASGGTVSGDGDGDEANTGGTSSGGFIITPPPTGGMAEIPPLPNPLLDVCTSSMGGMGGGSQAVGDPEGSLVIEDFDDMDPSVSGNGLSGRWESHNDGSGMEAEDDPMSMMSPLRGFRYPESEWGNDAFDVGRDGMGYSLHMTGSGFTSWGSGQAIYLAQGSDGLACLFDGSAYAGITFWARGNVELMLPDDPFSQPREPEFGMLRIKAVDLDVVANGGEELEPDATAGGRCDQESYRCWDSPVSRVALNENPECWQKYVIPFSEMVADEWSKWAGNANSNDVTTVDADELFQIAFEVSEWQSYEVWLDDIQFYTEDDVPAEEGPVCP